MSSFFIVFLRSFGKIQDVMENMLEKINKSAVKFLVPLTTEETFKIVVSEAKRVIGGDYGSIFLEQNGDLVRVYADAAFFHSFKTRQRGNTYNTFKSNSPYVIVVDKQKHFHKEIINHDIKTIIHIPLSYKDRSIGVLTVHSLQQKNFSKKDLHIFTLFGSLASMAIRKTQLYSETKAALETRDLFISLASHELRTPLTSINGYIQLLHSKLSKKDTAEAKWVQELYDESKRLTNLVKELLEVNRIKQGQLQYELRECKIEEFVDNALERYSFINPDRHFVYENTIKSENTIIIGDCDKLLQVITALLENADKFSSAKEPITVRLKGTKAQIIIQIMDKGSGIARQDLSRVFDGFYKGENKNTEGLGVGLLLAKHIIQYHHGSIQLKSKKQKGTIVEVRLPRSKVFLS